MGLTVFVVLVVLATAAESLLPRPRRERPADEQDEATSGPARRSSSAA
ncbi:hypothetical protein KZZ52_47535 [Dactylosporangium sp. AC04546]|nr:hypothetical protein [Dactylosporangium sp. AC04546]WVK81565.1 hypothetical protein KZZ52_47535 [Dactylosporangium sp. AC04546]